ncbi:MAG TPA: sigma 54-interacting transcriptional regulator [Pyrinomonadaceae bacterium]|jgi:Nif-specific regulatory protein
MNPRLLAVSGFSEGASFALDGDEISIGREETNDIHLPDRSLSRRHCLIKKEDEVFRIIDFESFNGTLVNGVPVKEQALNHGDQITLGNVLFLFLLHETQSESSVNSIELEDDLSGGSTIRLHRQNALYLNPKQFLASLSSSDRAARDLSALLKFNIRLNKLRDLESLQRHTLEAIFEVLPAERGVILFTGESLQDVTAVFSRNRKSEIKQPAKISQTIAEQVIREAAAILWQNAEANSAFKQAESLMTSQVKSLLCAPLIVAERVTGVIYLDSDNSTESFDENHLQFLTAVAGIFSVALENIRHLEWLNNENRRLRREINLEHDMIGESPRMQSVYRFIEKAAPTDATILIRGESGTGKELVARAVHVNSKRLAKPFIAVNCAVLSENLLESELFGHEKGAFTGAVAQRQGKFEMADGGTLFLDEIGEMLPALQAKLLRVLQERKFERVGGTRTLGVDVRIIAATNRNLESEIKNGNFREDLYYRLNVVTVTMPPLRERPEDILLLADYFALKYGRKCKRPISGIAKQARAFLLAYDFPGNVRELENAIERAVVLGGSDIIMPEDLPESMLESNNSQLPVAEYHRAVNEMKKNLILKTLEQANGNYTEAAGLLGIHPANLHRIIRTLNLKHLFNKK